MLLSHNELVQLVEDGVISNVSMDMINAASIDLTLADTFLFEVPPTDPLPVDLAKKGNITLFPRTINKGGRVIVNPGDFLLASTEQIFHLPDDISCEYSLKSSLARNGLEHLHAGWCDAGWNGSALTLEFSNMTKHHQLALTPGMKIGQVKFFRHTKVPSEASYAVRGQYNGDTSTQGAKELK